MADAVANISSTIQSASINRHPSPDHDLNPSTAASLKQPVSPTISTSSKSTIPRYTIRPSPRRSHLPPLPDLRFEQSYLASIRNAESYWGVAWITWRDQVMLPLIQGTLWTLALAGWRYWNRGVKMQGVSIGARVRRWWWGVNGWQLPKAEGSG
ncbi:MAG: hypothetical protein Q9163_004178 [Psora crenata]